MSVTSAVLRTRVLAATLGLAMLPVAAGAQAAGPRAAARLPAAAGTPRDTVRPRAITLSDGYETRLRIHRYTAYAIVPLFAYQWIVGQQLWDGVTGDEPPAGWVRPAHRAGAVAIGTAFGVNTVTGAMNLWETRSQPEGRTMRILHAATMTTALAGFAYTGIKLSEEAERSADKRRQHRNVALGSMALTLVSGTAMWLANH
jgi:hypothetical protein